MKCEICNYWKMGIPVGHCLHPDGKYQFTSDVMVFVRVTEDNCPKVREQEKE